MVKFQTRKSRFGGRILLLNRLSVAMGCCDDVVTDIRQQQARFPQPFARSELLCMPAHSGAAKAALCTI